MAAAAIHRGYWLCGFGVLAMALSAPLAAAELAPTAVLDVDRQQALGRYVDAQAMVATRQLEFEHAKDIVASTSSAKSTAQSLVTQAKAFEAEFESWAYASQQYQIPLRDCSVSIAQLISAREALSLSEEQLRTLSRQFNAQGMVDPAAISAMDGKLKNYFALNERAKISFRESVLATKNCQQGSEEQSNQSRRLIGPSGKQQKIVELSDRLVSAITELSSEASVLADNTDVPPDLVQTFATEPRLHDEITARMPPYLAASELWHRAWPTYQSTGELLYRMKTDLENYQNAAAAEIAESAASEFWQAGILVKERACHEDLACISRVDSQALNAQKRQASAQQSMMEAKAQVEVDAAQLQHSIVESQTQVLHILRVSQALRGAEILNLDQLQTLDTAVQQANQWQTQALSDLQNAEREADSAFFAAFGLMRAQNIHTLTAGQAALQVEKLPEGNPVGSPNIVEHGYQLIGELGDETKGYGAYTYVLFPRRVNDSAVPIEPLTGQRYKALLDALEATTLEVGKLRLNKSLWTKINVFCIPSLERHSGVSLTGYSTTVALQYLALAKGGVIRRASIMEKLVAGEGPFLLTSFAPMNSLLTNAPLLLADLSDIPPEAFNAVLSDYKLGLTKLHSASDQQIWQPAIGQQAALLFVRVAPDVIESMKWVKKFVGMSGKEAVGVN